VNHDGFQDSVHKLDPDYAIAVRDGDIVPIPEPSTALLFGVGLLGLAGWRRADRPRP
jgi:hypothetical protein